jgi:type I restriction enzyme, S subunit
MRSICYSLKRLSDVGVSLLDCEHRTPKASSVGYPYIAIPNIKEGRLDLSDVRLISKEDFDSWTKKTKPLAGDIIVTRRARVGDTAVVPPGLECAIGQNLVILRSDGTKLDQSYLRWVLQGTMYQEQVRKFMNVGAVFDSLNCADIPKFEIPVPPLPEQRAIARILGSLDDKIEANRRMNETLEAMARTLFKSWFIDFDPVRARAEGRAPAGMDAETAALFPDGFEEQEGRMLPKGWRTETIGDVLVLAYGKALKEDCRKPGKIPVFGSNGEVGWHDEKLADGPGIIVGRKGNPGIVTWSPTDFFSIDTTFYVQPKGSCKSMFYLFHSLRNQDLASLGADSAVPGLNRNLAYMSQMLVPSSEVLESFDNHISILCEMIQANDVQSQDIAATRDALLPKLLSGEVRVKVAGE